MRKPARAFGVVVLVAACTGLDPGKFRPEASPKEKPSVAGYAFDAGPGPDRAGAAGSRATGGASSGVRPIPDSGSDSEGGAAGESEGGVGATPTDAGRGGAVVGHGGKGGAGSGGRGGSAGLGGAAGNETAGAGAGQGGSSATHALFFSEYVEGSSSYKALEITAREPSTFVGCRLVTYFNGSVSGSGIALDGALSGGSTYVLCSTALATLVGPACHRATNLTFNGDDAVALECDGAVLDVIGQVGVDPGDGWGSGESSTLNHTLRRNCSSSSGDQNGSDAFDPASEWAAFSVDTFDGLGLAECAGG